MSTAYKRNGIKGRQNVFGQRYRALVGSSSAVTIVKRIVKKIPDHRINEIYWNWIAVSLRQQYNSCRRIRCHVLLRKPYTLSGHTFVVGENLSQNIIIGRDCLKKHGMRIDFGKNELQLQNCTVTIESESYLDSLVRVTSQNIEATDCY